MGNCGGQALQQRQREAGGLAGAGLGAGKHVAALEDDGNGLRLYRRGFGVALLGDDAGEFGRQAETGKRLTQEDLLRSTCCGTTPSEPVQADTAVDWMVRGVRELPGGTWDRAADRMTCGSVLPLHYTRFRVGQTEKPAPVDDRGRLQGERDRNDQAAFLAFGAAATDSSALTAVSAATLALASAISPTCLAALLIVS